MTVIICDRCGCKILKPTNEIKKVHVIERSYDLCTLCFVQFVEFIGGKKDAP